MASLQGLHESEAVIASLEAKVDDHQIGRVPLDRAQPCAASGGSSADRKVGLAVDHAQTAPDDGMILDDDDRLLPLRHTLTRRRTFRRRFDGADGIEKTQETAVP